MTRAGREAAVCSNSSRCCQASEVTEVAAAAAEVATGVEEGVTEEGVTEAEEA